MITKEEAKEKIKHLVEEFSGIHKSQLDDMKEEQIKWLFVEPLLEALGWGKKEIEKEARVLKGRADYILKNGNQEVLVIETKKANIPLDEEEGRQAVSYAYHRKIKFAVLTNFKCLRVYHALSNIKNIDKNLLKVNNEYFRLEFKEFLEKFDTLWLLSKESFEKGEINKLLSSKDEKLNKPIDENILDDLLNIRSWLSKDLKSKRMPLSQEDIDEVVQILIDRLIFIRSVEDRGLEPMNYLKSLESDVRKQQGTKLQLFPYILEKFEEFNKKYDSKLFEKGLLEKEGAFSDDVLRKVILALYFGSDNNQDRYLFDLIPGDLFGSIYEQYLGTILQSTEKRVKLEGKSGKRKKMGIYYTPSYIVDYIVKNTVHEYIKDKTIDEISKVKILDPACGSGSFLTRAFQEVCDVVEDKLKKGERGSKIVFKNYSDRLSLGQKIDILISCIHGVDLDEKAVELTRLNLLLKLLDGEGQDTRKLLLPHLENNIKCGNSLIDDTKVSDRAFKWETEFRNVFSDGGFDVVVGNPPYVRVDSLNNNDKEFWKDKFKSSKGKYDLYYLFVELVFNLLKKKGLLGFIIPNKFCAATSAKNLREIILANSESCNIFSVSHLPVFKDAANYPVLIILKKGLNLDKLNIYLIKKESELMDNSFIGYQIGQKSLTFLPSEILPININKPQFDLVINLLKENKKLGEFMKISEGLRIPEKLEENKGNFEIIKQFQFEKWMYIKKGNFISQNNLKKVISEDSERYKNIVKEKIIIAEDALNITAIIDDKKRIPQGGVYFATLLLDKLSLKIFLLLLNSKLLSFTYKILFGGMHMGGGYLRYRTEFLEQLPIRLPSPSQEKKILSLVEQMLSLQKKFYDEKTIGNEKERLKSQIDAVDYEIDEEVYKLYGITDEEKKIIEESLK